MAVPSSREALLGLQMVIGRERVPFETLLRHPYLPDGYEPVDPTKDERRWLWSDPPPGLVGGYGNPDTYRLADADPAVWLSPAEVLSPRQPEDRRNAQPNASIEGKSVNPSPAKDKS